MKLSKANHSEALEESDGSGALPNSVQTLQLHCKLVEEGCIECGLCQKDFRFWQRYLSPKHITV